MRALSGRGLPPRQRAMARSEPEGRARKLGILRGCRMTTAVATPRVGGRLTALLALVALLVLGSGIAFFVLEARPGPAATPSVPADALYGIAIDAENAVGGDAAALNNFQNQLRLLKEDAARDAGAAYVKDPRFI